MLKFIEDHGYEKGIKWEGSLPALKTAKGPGHSAYAAPLRQALRLLRSMSLLLMALNVGAAVRLLDAQKAVVLLDIIDEQGAAPEDRPKIPGFFFCSFGDGFFQ